MLKGSKYIIKKDEDLGLSEVSKTIKEDINLEDEKEKLQNKYGILYSLEQANAIRWDKGALIINACAGSGKTTTLCTSALERAITLGKDPSRMLAITFSNKASKDMVSRYVELAVKVAKDRESKMKLIARKPSFKTFHAFFKQTIESYIGESVSVVDEGKYNRILLQQINDYSGKENTEILKDIMLYRGVNINFAKSPDGIKNIVINEEKDGFSKKNYFAVIEKYEELKKEDDVIDFEDMQVILLDILENNKDKRKEIVDKFNSLYDYVYMDEYQDISPIQKKIFDYLLENNTDKLMVIGDDDQSIYSFRGSDPKFIMDFKYNYIGSTSLFLSVNYRCPKFILDVVKESIQKNTFRIEKEMNALDKDGYLEHYLDDSDFSSLADKIKEVSVNYADEELPSSIAVLVRINSQKTIIADSLITNKVPVNIGNISSSLRNNNIYKLLNKIINMIKLKDNNIFSEIGHRILPNIHKKIIASYSNNKERNWYDDIITDEMYKLTETQKNLICKINKEDDAYPLFEMAWGLIYDNLKNATSKGFGNMTSYEQIYNYILSICDGYYIDEFLELEKRKEVMLQKYIINNTGVSVLTMHSVKGLEYDITFLPELDSGIFPNDSKLNALIKDGKVLEAISMFEEERRLFYVAFTRTKEKIYISNTKGKLPSIFLTECNYSDKCNITEELKNTKTYKFEDLLVDNSNYIDYVSKNYTKGYGDNYFKERNESIYKKLLAKECNGDSISEKEAYALKKFKEIFKE